MHAHSGRAALLGNREIESVKGGDMGRAKGQKPRGVPPPGMGTQGRGGTVGQWGMLALSSLTCQVGTPRDGDAEVSTGEMLMVGSQRSQQTEDESDPHLVH